MLTLLNELDSFKVLNCIRYNKNRVLIVLDSSTGAAYETVHIQLTTTDQFACCVALVKFSLVPNKGRPRLQSKLQPNGEAMNL